MKRIIIFSDTHNNIKRCIKTLDILPCNLVIHLGDCVSDVLNLIKLYPNIKFEYISGNNDFFTSVPNKKIVVFESIRLLITHGHLYDKNSLNHIAKENRCNYVLTGHTHRSMIERNGEIVFMNPGSISRPRDGAFSYGVIEIEKDNSYKECIIKEEF